MAFKSVARLYPLLPQVSSTLAPASLVTKRSMTLEGLKGYKEREVAQENVYFHNEDEKLLRKLLKKVKTQAEQTMSAAEVDQVKAAELAPLKSLIEKYKISEADTEVLLDWKHHA